MSALIGSLNSTVHTITPLSLVSLVFLSHDKLPGGLSMIPFMCRIAAFVLAAPFAVCFALEIIAYAIARTLHLSMQQKRVPRSPLYSPRELKPDETSSPDKSALKSVLARFSSSSVVPFASSAPTPTYAETPPATD